MDALDAAFYAAFQNVEPCGKPVLLALDVSGSMDGGSVAGSCLTPREASAALALHPQYDLFRQWTSVKRPLLEGMLGGQFIHYGEWLFASH